MGESKAPVASAAQQKLINRALSSKRSGAASSQKRSTSTVSLREYYNKRKEQQRYVQPKNSQGPSKENQGVNRNGRAASAGSENAPSVGMGQVGLAPRAPGSSNQLVTLRNLSVSSEPNKISASNTLQPGSKHRPLSLGPRSSTEDVKYIQPFKDSAAVALEEVPPPSKKKNKKKKKGNQTKISVVKKGTNTKQNPLMLGSCAPLVGPSDDEEELDPKPTARERGRSRTRRRSCAESSDDDSSLESFGDISEGAFDEDSLAADYAAFLCGGLCSTGTENSKDLPTIQEEKSKPEQGMIESSSETAMKSVKYLSEQSSKLHRDISRSFSKESIGSYLDMVEKTLKLGTSTGGNSDDVPEGVSTDHSESGDWDTTTTGSSSKQHDYEGSRGRNHSGEQHDRRVSAMERDEIMMDRSFDPDSAKQGTCRLLDCSLDTLPVNNTTSSSSAGDTSFDAPKAELVAVLQGKVGTLATTYRHGTADCHEQQPPSERGASDLKHLASF